MSGNNSNVPKALDAERSVLGGMIIDTDGREEVLEVLQKEHFYLQRHRTIFQAIFELVADDEPVDTLSLSQKLAKMKKLSEVGGKSYLIELQEDLFAAMNSSYYSQIVIDKSILRELIRIGSHVIQEASREQQPAQDVLELAEQEIFNLAEKRINQDFVSIGSIAPEVYNYIESIHDRDYQGDEVRTHFSRLDKQTTGFKPADYFILAGATSSGKTAFALSIARNIALPPAGATPRSVAIFSLEMAQEQLVMRLFAGVARLDAQKIREGNLSIEEREQLKNALPDIQDAPVFMDESASLNIMTMRSKLRKLMRRQKDLGLVIVDYLQLMQPVSKHNSREREIAEISHGLKAIARDLKVPVLALSQLSRKVESRTGDPKPRLSDLRESGSIEQDADAVIFIYRAEYYNRPFVMIGDMKKASKGVAEVIIAKQRNGPVGSFFMQFTPQFTSFGDINVNDIPDYFNDDDEGDSSPWDGGNNPSGGMKVGGV
ncbi:MAG: replicative DNA helicase [Candidatus Zixiibacteriota bacterium]